jgi:dipeptidyl aminopeptidase/acylaminoacyl peptidase
VHQYVLINLQTGSVQSLADAPLSTDQGSWAIVFGSPNWSSDGQEILLPGTFLNPKYHASARPCVAIVDLPSNTRTCVETLRGRTETGVEEGYRTIRKPHFVEGDSQHVMMTYYNYQGSSAETVEYGHFADRTWRVVQERNGVLEVGHNSLEVTVKEGINEPPKLVATYKQASRVIWDPNPQLKDIELGDAIVYIWKDKEGRDWRSGLFKPTDYKPGKRYPLVIQTHGFLASEFRPSGLYPTAFAARALAAAGIIVLQVQNHCPIGLDEGSCAVSEYEAAANQLVSEGLVDPNRIGIIGFSRTCFYVMETLTNGSLHLRAASITDGVMETYLQYMMMMDWQGHEIAQEADLMIGAQPFGEGLQKWRSRSPGFNLDKISAPLLIASENGPGGLLFMWEPYAGLRYLQKPVDLIMLNTDEHVLTNPALRMASQGGSVDWFRFWLQDYEDPDPAKTEQYVRWRKLRQLQKENESKMTRSQADSN